MYVPPELADQMLQQALSVVQAGAPRFAALDALPAAIYVTDSDGLITYFNPACVDFSGRQPEVGQDRWCVTWKLYTEDGEYLPHDQCPMAVALKTGQTVRNVRAVAERPDGGRVAFMPYPTPILAADGAVAGALNMLIDITAGRHAEYLRAQAARCQRLAFATDDLEAMQALTDMAAEYRAKADSLDAESDT